MEAGEQSLWCRCMWGVVGFRNTAQTALCAGTVARLGRRGRCRLCQEDNRLVQPTGIPCEGPAREPWTARVAEPSAGLLSVVPYRERDGTEERGGSPELMCLPHQ